MLHSKNNQGDKKVNHSCKVIVTGPDKKFRAGWWATKFCLKLYGMDAHYLTPKGYSRRMKSLSTADLNSPDKASKRKALDFQGIIIGGGDDIEPKHYGITGDAGTDYDEARDQLELMMVKQALKAKIPILGICRGAQLINIALGGSLYRDIRPLRHLTPNKNSVFPMKEVLVKDRSYLEEITVSNSFSVNSFHNQAIERLGKTLRVSARDKDAFVQAIEASNMQNQFILGVQWHPEYLPYLKNQRRIFASFIEAVKHSQHQLHTIDALQVS